MANRILEAIFVQMFGDSLRNQMGWTTKTLGEVIDKDPDNGLFKKKEFYGSGVPIVWVESLFENQILDTEGLRLISADVKEVEKYKLNSGDVLVCRSSLPVEGVGKMVVVKNSETAVLFESHVMRIRPKIEEVLSEFLVEYFNSRCGRKLVLSKARIGTMTTINQPDIKSLRIFLPPIELQQKFVELFYIIDCIAKKQRCSTKETETLFNSIISKAFNGKLVS